MQKEEGSRKSAIINSFYDKPQHFLSTMLIGNNIALVAFTFLMTKLLESLFPALAANALLSLFIFTLLITLVVLIFGEFIPKTFCSLYSNQALNSFAFPLVLFRWLLAGPTWFMNLFTNGLLRLLRLPATKSDYRLSSVDLEDYLDENIGEEDDDIDKEILNNALSLKDIKVRDCMIPRTEIVHYDIHDSLIELIKLFQESKHSRIVVVDNDIEEIIGYIHHQQLLDNPKTIKNIVYDLPFVPEAMNLNDLLHNFIKQRTNIAAVVDEFGSIAGLITLEDILEEIFGEIEDEHDAEDYIDEKIDEKFFRFSGRLEIDYLNETYPILKIPEGEYQTLSGFLVTHTGSIPEVGEEILHEQNIYAIEEMSDTKIEVVMIKVMDDDNQL